MIATLFQSPSMLSLRGPEFEDREGKLPPIRPDEADLLFERPDLRAGQEYARSESRMSVTSPEWSSASSHLPNIESDREDSAR